MAKKREASSGTHHVIAPEGNQAFALRHETLTPHVKGNGEYGTDSSGFIKGITQTGDARKASSLGRKIGR